MNTTTYIKYCWPLLSNISSNGLWELKSPNVIFGYSLPLIEIQILLIVVSISISHMYFKCIGISQIASYMIGGMIMGPNLFDLRQNSSKKLSRDPVLSGNATLKGFQMFGAIMFTFLMTVKTNRRVVFNTGLLPIVIGILTFIIPLIVGLCFRNLFTENINPYYMPQKKALVERSLIIGTQSSILLPTVTYILSELKILNSEFGRLALSASIINDVLGITFLVLGYALATYKYISRPLAYISIIAVIIFFLIVYFVFRPIAEWIVEHTPEGKPVAEIYVHVVMLIVLASSVYSTLFNMKYLLGPFIIALFIPEGPPFGSTLEAKYEKLTMNVFLPITIASSTMRCDIMRIIYELDDISYNIFLVSLTLFLKLVASLVPCLYCKLPLKESLAVSILLSCKSFPELFFYETSLDDTYMSLATYSFLVIYALLNSGIIPMVLRSLYDPNRKYIGYRKRNILCLKQNSDLRILICVHRPDNISGTVAFLQLLSSLNHELPIVATILYLVKIVGQMVPVLISHNKISKQLIINSYINSVILTFRQFNQENSNSTTVTMFTALSHENLMYEEICMLALEKTTSMIIVPSGRTWTINGDFESDNEAIRRLNMLLLESAPCSMGILVDRGKLLHRGKRKNNINVGVIFIGGKDDREALSLGNMMKHNPMVHVTVIRLITNHETDSMNMKYILDHDIIRELKDSETTNNVAYIEKSVIGGPEVATTVRLLAEDYDLMIVGRDHGMASPDFSGLKEWIELPELGVIGDLLAVKDLKSRVSVLVVQQQLYA